MAPYKKKRGTTMPTTRFDMRLDQEIKAKAEKASALLGLKSLTEYIVKLIDDNATQVIAQHESIIVENDIFDLFISACEKTQKPNKTLLDAKSFAKEQGIK
jgi:uncharacterized protein (DUF1778 family)